MRLSWNEIRVRAKTFSEDWKEARYEKGETQSFYNDFFEVFGVKRRQVGRYEEAVKDLKGNSQFIDLFWPGMLIVEQKSAGRDLSKAESQAFRYFAGRDERPQDACVLSEMESAYDERGSFIDMLARFATSDALLYRSDDEVTP